MGNFRGREIFAIFADKLILQGIFFSIADRKILDDLSSADQTLKGSADPLSVAAAATLQAQQVSTSFTWCHRNFFTSLH